MTRDQVIAMAREVGIQANVGYIIDGEHKPAIAALKTSVPVEWLEALVEKAAAKERERIAVIIRSSIHAARYHFADQAKRDAVDRVLLDLLDEVVVDEEAQPELEAYTPPPPTPEQLRINEMKRGILSRILA